MLHMPVGVVNPSGLWLATQIEDNKNAIKYKSLINYM
jgi:hypothetical protein